MAAVAAVGLVSVLAACDHPKRALGLEKQAPDEFAVVTRAPLSLPPDYNLRPPEPGVPRPQEGTTRDQARRVITGNPTQSSALTSAAPLENQTPGEAALLEQAGADRAVANIRQVVDRETTTLASESRSFTDVLQFWRPPNEYGTELDPVAESRRLRENQALGRPPTTGATPTIERRERGLLQGLF